MQKEIETEKKSDLIQIITTYIQKLTKTQQS